jgi:ssDNA-binding protein
MSDDDKKAMRVTSPVFRLSFPNLKQPKANFEGQAPAYSIQMLFDETADLSKMRKAFEAAAVKKWGADYKKKVKFKHPTFKDGNEKNLEDYKGKIVVEARTKQKPGVVDVNREEILDLNEVYAGCYCRATLTVFAYEKAGNKGVSFGLQNVQKVKDGPAFSGRKNAKDDFDDDIEFDLAEEAGEDFEGAADDAGADEF